MRRTIATMATILAVAGTSSFIVVQSKEETAKIADSQSDRSDIRVSRSVTRQPIAEYKQMANDKLANQKAMAEKKAKELLEAEKRKQEQKAREIAEQAKRAAEAAAAERAERERQENSKPVVTQPRVEQPVVNSNPKQYALNQLGQTQYGCFNNIVIKESGWNHTATNPSSGAYGLVQALPGSKMASAGSDWQTNPITQIDWGISYMNDRYGSPCGAWGFWLNNRWY